MCVCVCVFGQYFLIKTYLIKQYRNLLSTYFCLDPFKLPYECYDIHLGLTNLSLLNGSPSTFRPILGHYQRVYILQK